MILNQITFILILCSSVLSSYGQSKLHIQNIGNLVTTSNDTIKNCKIGYRTFGKLNKEKNNVVFMPTWHLGTSENNLEYLKSILDTNGRYLIVVDALGNGISSSPSNYPDFPDISIRDMVNSQYELLVNHLEIEQVDLLVGMSMGGMQAFEWMVAYPEFMDKLISIHGTTKPSFYDKALWNTLVTLIEDARSDKESLEYAMKRVQDIKFLTRTSPAYVSKTYETHDFEEFKEESYNQKSTPFNQLTQSKAILEHDIYKSLKVDPENLSDLVKAEILIIVAEQDHVVNPINSEKLAKELDCDLLILKGECGHIAALCEVELVKQTIYDFLKK